MFCVYSTYRTCTSTSWPFSSAAQDWRGKLVNIGKCAGNDLGYNQQEKRRTNKNDLGYNLLGKTPADDGLVCVRWNCRLYHINWDLWHEVGQASDKKNELEWKIKFETFFR